MTSTIKVNNIQNQCGANIIKENSNTITLGASGDTIALASGASQTGFGRTGTVDWQTTPKTATFTAVSGEGYFCNTAGGTFEVDLPAGSAGAIVSIQDYNNTFDSNSLTIDPNGSEKINGGVAGGFVTLSTEGLGLTFVYIDATVGWRSIQSNEYKTSGSIPTFVTASGGNATVTCGNFKTHIFTGPGTFCVSAVGCACGSNSVDYMVVAGGGGGGTVSGATGGGAGGFRVSNSYSIPAPTMSPLSNPTGLPVSVQGYTIAVGGGGAGGALPSTDGVNGSVSTFSTITSAGGGKGRGPGNGTGYAGGSGSGGKGAAGPESNGYAGGAGNTPPVSPSQGNNGGAGYDGFTLSTNGGGGGGAGAVGGTAACSTGGVGGAGSFIADGFINPTSPSYGTPGPVGSTRFFSGGGGGTTCGGPGGQPVTFGVGGAGGGGAGASAASSSGGSATVNTGGGGGGGIGNPASPGGVGGSGIVMIRYKFQ